MNDLNTLLDRAAGPATAPVDARTDLTRAHLALSRTRRRRGAAGLVGVAAASVLGVGITRYVATEDAPPRASDTPKEDSSTKDDQGGVGFGFRAQPFEAGPYIFDATPEGWEVQGVVPSAVTIAPIGFADRQPLSFVGKLVIMFDGNPPTGERVDLEGRTLWVRQSGHGYTTIATRTQPGEPAGTVSIQYPSDTGWTRDQMLAFLAGVHVGAGAEQSVG